MRILLLDTALPLAGGSPRQRAASALRDDIAAGAEVAHLTLDAWHVEWSSRMRQRVGDRLMPAARTARSPRPFLALPRRAATAPPTMAEVGPSTDLARGWLGPSRCQRLRRLIEREAADLIVLGDPLLATLLPLLGPVGAPVRVVDDGSAAWHGAVARRAPSAEAAAWHRRLADALSAAPGPGAILPPPLPPGLPPLSRARSLAVAASGVAWLDAAGLDALAEALEVLAARGTTPPEVALLGFSRSLTRRWPSAVVHEGWQMLAGVAASSLGLLLPAMSPALARVARAALAAGTPVVTDPADAAALGLAGQPGLHGAPAGRLAGVLAFLLDPACVTDADRDDMAQAARVASGARPAEPLAPWRRDGAATRIERRPLRHDPLVGEPAVHYNPLSMMLLARLSFRPATGAEEVRLIDSAGQEIIRLLPNAAQRRQSLLTLEGGAIVPWDRIAGGLGLELHDAEGPIRTVAVAAADIVHLEAEIATAELDGVTLRGAFWTTDLDPAARWALGTDAFQFALAPSRAVRLADLGAVAVPFEVPIRPLPHTQLDVWRQLDRPVARRERLTQRPLALIAQAVAGPVPPHPQVAALKDIHVGRRGWIVGNGPSVRLEDLAAIPPGDVTFCFNRFHLSYDRSPLRETYLVSADTLMIDDFGQEMIDVTAGLPLFCLKPSAADRLRGDFVRLTAGDTHLPIFSTDPGRFVSVGGSSVFVALQMALHMGLTDMVLYGLDYSFSLKPRRDPRFPFPVSFEEGNHFISGYRGAKPWCPPTWRDISAGFLNARVAFEMAGARIVNATRGGKLELFPRRDFDEVVAEGQPAERRA